MSTGFEEIRRLVLAKPGAEEEFPFGPEVMVFKVGGKIFALLAYEELPPSVNLKCDPARAVELRERYAAVQPGYHMNKKHWNTVTLDGSIPLREVREMIGHSYELVANALPQAAREALGLGRSPGKAQGR